MEYNPVTQVIISLIILLLMGYVAYNIYLIELHHMFKGKNDIKKEIDIFTGIKDFGKNKDDMYNTKNKAHETYRDISPSMNQEGGAEYSYNFWLYVDQSRIQNLENDNKKDILLFLKGEKIFYYNNEYNYNCSFQTQTGKKNPVLITKNPLVRLSHDGKNLAVDYNNILSPESYQNNSKYRRCEDVSNNNTWWERNRNMIGIYDIEFSNKWFMVSIVMKEVADNNNILTKNRAICRIYINGLLVFENKLETIYGSNQDIYSATFKNNNSPLYVNPVFIVKESDPPKANDMRKSGCYNKCENFLDALTFHRLIFRSKSLRPLLILKKIGVPQYQNDSHCKILFLKYHPHIVDLFQIQPLLDCLLRVSMRRLNQQDQLQ